MCYNLLPCLLVRQQIWQLLLPLAAAPRASRGRFSAKRYFLKRQANASHISDDRPMVSFCFVPSFISSQDKSTPRSSVMAGPKTESILPHPFSCRLWHPAYQAALSPLHPLRLAPYQNHGLLLQGQQQDIGCTAQPTYSGPTA